MRTPTPAPTAGLSFPRLVVAQAAGELIQVDPQGQGAPFATLPDLSDESDTTIVDALAVGETVYLQAGFPDSQFLAAGPHSVRRLDFIAPEGGMIRGFAVWPGEGGQPGRVAWSVNGPEGRVRLVSSRLDGSERQLLAEGRFDPETNTDGSWHVLRWSDDGDTLFFSRQPGGAGGLILFGGYFSLWAYDFGSGEVRPIQPVSPCGNPFALEPLSPSGEWLPDHCGQQLHLTKLQTGERLDVAFPPEVGEVGQFGGVVYSPDGQRYAYAVEVGVSSGAFTSDPKAVQGWVAAGELGATRSQLVVTSPAGSYFRVRAWLPGDVLVLVQDDRKTSSRSVWTVNVDGTELQKVAEGQFLAVLTQP